MRHEIGSEFWDVPVAGNNALFPAETKWFISGRSALLAIIKENKFNTVAMPDWCCDSMIKPFTDSGIKVYFYPAFTDIGTITADAALVMDYFGYTGHSGRGSFQGVIIRDITHSVFSATYSDADYYFGSMRKWAGFYTGGFAWGFKNPVMYEEDTTEYGSLRQAAMQNKALYISGSVDSKEYLTQFNTAEEVLETVGVLPADERDIKLIEKLDVASIRRQRRKNAAILLDAFSDIAVFSTMKDTDCPMFVPILVEKRNELRKFLIEKEIYCPVHWPVSKYHNLTKETQVFYDRELSLVCDQRYTEQDMLRIIDAVKEFLDKEA